MTFLPRIGVRRARQLRNPEVSMVSLDPDAEEKTPGTTTVGSKKDVRAGKQHRPTAKLKAWCVGSAATLVNSGAGASCALFVQLLFAKFIRFTDILLEPCMGIVCGWFRTLASEFLYEELFGSKGANRSTDASGPEEMSSSWPSSAASALCWTYGSLVLSSLACVALKSFSEWPEAEIAVRSRIGCWFFPISCVEPATSLLYS